MGMFDVLSGGNRRGGGMSPIALAVIGALAYKALKGKGRLVDDVMRSGQPAPDTADTSAKPRPTAGGGGLERLLDGLGAGGIGAGLKDLLDRFRQSGHEDKAQSWVSTGANRPIEPRELEEVLGAERIQWLMEQTGLPKDQLLAGVSSELPSTIDKLTPEGHVPTEEEIGQQLRH
jgi:uncharacterized protein YidB (DUF937 family)